MGTADAVSFLAPAKLNLTLQVFGKRPDGFHHIRSVMVPVSLYDEVTVEEAPHGIAVECDDPSVPMGEGNTCRRAAVAVDAGCDPDSKFEDLANAIRKCWTDFGVRIDIDLAALQPQGTPKRTQSHFAVGCIRYPNAPEPGVLIYIKASFSGDEPSEVKEYAEHHASFPHESTGDQFFDENQFESYRELGRHIGLKVFAPLFSPLLNTSARQMTPQQIRDALPAAYRITPPCSPGRKKATPRKRRRPEEAPAGNDGQRCLAARPRIGKHSLHVARPKLGKLEKACL